MRPVVWGVLGAARIALERVIPAMHPSDLCEVRAIASRDARRAAEAARTARVAVSLGSYEDLLADPKIEAVYIPLPNHLHVEWSIRALEAGKHVLCEKPIACTAGEVGPLIEARNRARLLVEEAVMVRDHPQWMHMRALIDEGRIGTLRNVQLSYSHFNDDPSDIRNVKDAGGGSLLDVGSYCTAIARLIFDAEPLRAMALLDRDPRFGTDRFTTATLEFPGGHASLFCSTQSSRCQMVQVIGTAGWIRAEVPFAHPPDLSARLVVGSNSVPPRVSSTASARAVMPASFATSTATWVALPPADAISPATDFADSSSMSATTTTSPSLPNRFAVARPMPLPPPVTTTMRFLLIVCCSVCHLFAQESDCRAGCRAPRIPAFPRMPAQVDFIRNCRGCRLPVFTEPSLIPLEDGGRRGPESESRIGCLLPDHDRRRVRVARRDPRHDRGIGDTQRLDTVHLEVETDHRHAIRAHPAGAHRMVVGSGARAGVVERRIVAFHPRSG